MSTKYVPISWKLTCPWCEWYAWVNPRGAHGNDPGSGVEAALIGRRHAEVVHGKTWSDFLRDESNQDTKL